MSRTVCKFECVKKETFNDGSQVTLYAVVDGSEENVRFFESTPGGKMVLGVLNPEAAEVFEEGSEYLVTFEKAAR